MPTFDKKFRAEKGNRKHAQNFVSVRAAIRTIKNCIGTDEFTVEVLPVLP